MNFQVAVHDAGFRVIAHSSSAKVMATANPGKAGATPGLGCAHCSQYLLRFTLHPIGQFALVFLKIVGDA